MKIVSDNAGIEKNLRILEKAFEEYGGSLDPDLIIRCEGPGLSVEKYGFANPNQPLIALPHEMLLPTNKMGLGVKNDEIFYSPEKDALTDIQRKMADTMIELYNLTGKIPAHKESCCWFLFKDHMDLLSKLLKGRTLNEMQVKMLKFSKEGASREETDKLLCDTYIKMRTIGHKQKGTGDEMVISPDIMPIVDFINHHSQGAFFGFIKDESQPTKTREFLTVYDSRPLAFSSECFAFYNQMDALDSFLMYGFADPYSPYVRSIPVEIEIPKTGKIIAYSALSVMHKGVLPKNAAGLRPYIPSTLKNTPDALEITSFLIPANSGSPHALRRILRLLITNRTALKRTLTTSEIWQAVLAAEEKIISQNIAFYRDVIAAMDEESKGADPRRMKLIKVVRDVAGLQLAKLYKYTFDESYFSASENTQDDNELKQTQIAAAE